MALIDQLDILFEGHRNAHGVFSPTSSPNSVKVQGTALTIQEPVTPALWKKHIEGTKGLGIVPINQESRCYWGAIDVDIYNLDLEELVARIERLKLPLVVCRTKSGGAHIFLFLEENVTALDMRNKLAELAGLLGHGRSELFPKQIELKTERSDVGNWLNMPYFEAATTTRYAFSPKGEQLSLEEFVTFAFSRRVSIKDFNRLGIYDEVPSDYKDGPPCLEVLAKQGMPEGARNNGMINFATFARKKWPNEGWAEKILEINKTVCRPPLSEHEVTGIIHRATSGKYNYRCNEEPISTHCNASLCRMRRYGVASGEGFPIISSLSQLKTDPPVYFADVNGRRIELDTDSLQNIQRFQKKCIDQLGFMPPLIKRDDWQSKMQELIGTMGYIEVPEDATPRGQFKQHLENFCTSRAQGRAIEDLLEGKPYTEDGYTYFRLSDLQRYLEAHGLRKFELNMIVSILRDMGGKSDKFFKKGKNCRYWKISAFEEQTEPHTVVPVEEDF